MARGRTEYTCRLPLIVRRSTLVITSPTSKRRATSGPPITICLLFPQMRPEKFE